MAGGHGASIMPRLALSVMPSGTVTRQLRPAVARQLGVVVRREKVLSRGLRVLLEALRATSNEDVGGRAKPGHDERSRRALLKLRGRANPHRRQFREIPGAPRPESP